VKNKNEITVTGEITSLPFRNSDNWATFKVFTNDTNKQYNCTGVLPQSTDTGDTVTVTGKLCESTKYGTQLKCFKIVPETPDVNTEAGVIKLLQKLPGLGPKKAAQAVKEHGPENAWNFAKKDPTKLGVPPAKTAEAMDIAAVMVEFAEATIYLLGIGLTSNQANKIIKEYGHDAIKTVQETPYVLSQTIDGFGFKITDAIALKAGIGVKNDARTMACVVHCLNDSQINNGHVYQWGKQLIAIVLDILKDSAAKAEVSLIGMPVYDDVRRCIYNLNNEGKIEIDGGKIYSAELLAAERSIEMEVTA